MRQDSNGYKQQEEVTVKYLKNATTASLLNSYRYFKFTTTTIYYKLLSTTAS